MSLNPLTPVTDYQSMLNRIFWFTSAAALVAIALLRSSLDGLDGFLGQIDGNLKIDGERTLPVPGGTLVPALLVGLASRVFRIHNKMGDWLGIRERFELDVILRELARGINWETVNVPVESLEARRYELMKKCFYQFVSGRHPQIDSQLVERALDMWSWFWIGMETAVVFVVTAFIFISSGEYSTGITTFAVTLTLAAIGLPAVRTECRRYAIAQVREILSDPDRAEQISQAFATLKSLEQHYYRRAA